ncbi:MAG: class I tRNA ligase family protein [Patescibacteria group bacterium]|nr:class I tRNA ligase family protein [Patescibacteria group bacterium]
MKYDFQKIERRWQKFWREKKVYEPLNMTRGKPNLKLSTSRQKPFYNLMMFPYPSAEGLHVGNMYAFTGGDVYGRFKRMQGFNVFEPMGLDGFGIHSENYALKIGVHPMKQAEISEKRFYKQLEMIGNGFAWDERLETYDPKYYRWTQWIFVQLFKHGLAYRKKAPVNWCPSCKTVLADEQVITGRCERCSHLVIKKELEQWFFKITKYADKLLKNLDKIDWSERVKIAQRNWIGRSEGAEIEFRIKNHESSIKVFTTRPDTLFGATYMVLAPEHELIENLESSINNLEEVKKYVKKAGSESDEERIAEDREKSGVELKGVKAVNPATKEEIPIWVADYVLGHVGTGAIMAVPAHDERDLEFAIKYDLPVRQVVEAEYTQMTEPGMVKKELPFVERDGIIAIIKHWSEEKYIGLKWKSVAWGTWVTGGIEKDQTPEQAARAEVLEEVGYRNLRFVKDLGIVHGKFYHVPKKENRWVHAHCLYFELEDDARDEVSEKEKAIHELTWLSKEEVERFLTPSTHLWAWRKLCGELVYIGNGYLKNSGKFDGIASEKAKWEITKFVGGKKEIHYRIRDWLISRQRYWGVPIPMIYCERCDWQPVPEKDLPVKLPFIKDFRPKGKGQSPLASEKSFYETKCPKCGGAARRETDVSDTFLDSAWYYLRYPSTRSAHSGQVPWDPEITKKWLPVDMYIGGAEHSVLHLLYSRFLAMAFNDWGLVHFKDGEPFTVFRAHGLLISEGKKMSKSKGNIVNPDFYVKKFGADAFRMYLMFLAPFEQGGDFRDAGILGITRFLERVWKLFNNDKKDKKDIDKNLEKSLHQSIKKVTEDIENLHYNTAISTLMILLSKMEEQGDKLSTGIYQTFLKLLAPFAPHITEELWSQLGSKKSIHIEPWPAYNPKLIEEETFKLIVQVNGKMRDTITADTGISQKEAEAIALSLENIKRHIGNKKSKKIIFVKDRLINFVI